jgi:menaquinol-cytochrome c reductase iron-sulfur subunit
VSGFLLVRVSKFPEGANRLAAYKTPYSREVDGETAILTCWVRRLEGDKFRIFASNCTHLGCPVRWFEQSQLFLWGAFYADGEHAAGPPLYTSMSIKLRMAN